MIRMHNVRRLPAIGVLFLMLSLAWSVPAMGSGITLEVMHRWSGDRHPLLREVLDRFEAAHPGVTVVDYEVGASLNERLTVAWLGGVGPDVAMVNIGSAAPFGAQGFLQPLEPFAAAEGTTIGALMYENIADAVVWDGKTFYLPMTLNVGRHLMYYNEDMFWEAGLNAAEPPATHSEWQEAARMLTRRDGEGSIVQRGIDIVTNNNARNYMLLRTMVEQWGGVFFDNVTNEVLPNVEQTIEVANWMLDFNQMMGGEIPSGAGEGRPPFQNRQAAMYLGIDGDWFIFTQADESFNVALAPPPAPDGEPLRTIVDPGWGWGISQETEHPELAWELVKWLSVAEQGGGWFIQQQGRMSSNPVVNADRAYLEIHPYFHVLAQVADAGLPAFQRCLNVSAGEAYGQIGGALTQAVAGEVDPRSALLEARRMLQAQCDIGL